MASQESPKSTESPEKHPVEGAFMAYIVDGEVYRSEGEYNAALREALDRPSGDDTMEYVPETRKVWCVEGGDGNLYELKPLEM